MFRIFQVLFILYSLNHIDLVENAGIRIPLYRQKTPHEIALNSPNLEKYGINLNWLRKRHYKPTNGTDSVALFRFLDMEFYGKVQIGTKAQTFNMMFDTTWRNSWVISEDCQWDTVGCWFHNKYDHRSSSTYVANGTKFNVNEGSYNLTGYYSNDTFLIGHTRAYGQLFIEMTYVPSQYLFSKVDGVMGLGFKLGQLDPFFYNLLKNKSVDAPLFSVYLNRDRQSSRGGNILLGFIDEKHIRHHLTPNNESIPEPITYLPVDPSAGYWQFKMDRVSVDLLDKNKTYAFCLNGCTAIADTGNNIIMGPISDISKIHELIEAKPAFFGRYRVKCDTVNKLPPIDFILAGKYFTLKGVNYIQKMSLGAVTVCISAFVSNSDASNQNWILSGAFLSQYYSIYDIGNKRIGFVTAN